MVINSVKNNFVVFAFLGIVLFLSCSEDLKPIDRLTAEELAAMASSSSETEYSSSSEEENPSSSSEVENSSSSEDLPINYCVYPEFGLCFSGSYSTCPGTGGVVSDACPSSSSGGGTSSSSSGVDLPSFGFCVFSAEKACLAGPVSDCPPGGELGNACPYSSSSSEVVVLSSSSEEVILSSSSEEVVISSSSEEAVISSSSEVAVLSSSSEEVVLSSSSEEVVLSSSSEEELNSSSSSEEELSSSSYGGLCADFDGSDNLHYGKLKNRFCDERDGTRYVYVTIGTGETAQVWMAENLNYNVAGSKCNGDNTGGDSQNRCGTYGRLYNWATAMNNSCPEGWHLPSDAEWGTLMRFVNPSCSTTDDCANAGLLRVASGWNSNGNGTDDHGFSALPGGYGTSAGSFRNVGSDGGWWSSTEYDSYGAYYRYTYYSSSTVRRLIDDKSYLFSVRCLQD